MQPARRAALLFLLVSVIVALSPGGDALGVDPPPGLSEDAGIRRKAILFQRVNNFIR
jgi:hypothetical protein